MIKINLLPATETRRRSRSRTPTEGGSQLFGVILILVLVLEAAGLYVWFSSADEEARAAKRAKNKVTQQRDRLKTLKAEFDKRKKEREQLHKQNQIFASLEVERTGPLEALQFLAYVLTKKNDTQQTDEALAQEAAGWVPSWNPDTVWLTEFEQSEDGWVTLRGLAKTTQDASEFLRRLETSIYFVAPDMLKLEPVADGQFPERLTLTAFEIQSILNYNKNGEFYMYAEDIPDALRASIKQPKKQPDSKKSGKKGKRKGKKG